MKLQTALPAAMAASWFLLTTTPVSAETIRMGGERGWIEGVCYQPIQKAMVGDVLEFEFGGHDVYQLLSRQSFDDCDFSSGLLLANVGESPFRYEITPNDAEDGILYFGCSLGDHCVGGTHKAQVEIEPYMGQALGNREAPLSETVAGVTPERCAEIQSGADLQGAEGDQASLSTCTDPVLQDDGRYYVSCLSPPATMTPGGVINNLFILQYPYPKDRRVVVGLRTWEFVQDAPDEMSFQFQSINYTFITFRDVSFLDKERRVFVEVNRMPRILLRMLS